ncbi:MAG: zinc-ribbon domain-containing protein [Lachnospiraceae bacterium]|jgi:ribosomal protein L37E|nr:zinc-ribbon domain-containing protein [Lachnospiraceae bacterium]
MALIKCPECGKENVSDSAEMCPECGYGIKAHFDLVKQRQLNQEIR